MTFHALEQTNQELFSNPELSEHNKEVLNEFFRKQRSSGGGDATVSDYASRFNTLASHIDFKLDEPEKRDLEKIIARFNQDEITKQNGEPYSDHSKAKFWKTLSVFYRQFIKEQGKGFAENVDGPELLEDLELRINPVTEVEPSTKPTPKEIKELAEAANTLRDKAIIIFGFSTGCRIGEIAVTQYDPEPIRWKHIKFKDDYMEVKISEQGPNNRGKTGERTIPVRIGMPLMKQLQEEKMGSLDDPVFKKEDAQRICPRCGEEASRKDGDDRLTYENRRYICSSCNWEGKTLETDAKYEPLTGNAVRRVIERCYRRSTVEREIDLNPHAVFRKARALHKAAVGWTEYQLRSQFGWSENSDAPKHYITITNQGLLAAMQEEFGDGVIQEDLGFNEDDIVKPVTCEDCRELNSCLNQYCRSCGTELSEDLVMHNRPEESQVKEMVDEAEEIGYEEEQFRQIVKGVLETMEGS